MFVGSTDALTAGLWIIKIALRNACNKVSGPKVFPSLLHLIAEMILGKINKEKPTVARKQEEGSFI